MRTSPIPRSRVLLLAARIHALGQRPLAELFIELLDGADVHDAMERYAQLYELRDFISSLGGDHLPAPARAL